MGTGEWLSKRCPTLAPDFARSVQSGGLSRARTNPSFESIVRQCRRRYVELLTVVVRVVICRLAYRRTAMYDMNNLKRLKAIDANAPGAAKAFWAFDKAALAEGAIPVKYKELMACAVAFTTQCPYCIQIHSDRAREAGATDKELAEVVMIAAALRAGAAVTHGTHAFADHR